MSADEIAEVVTVAMSRDQRLIEELPPGMIEYEARVAIRDLVRLLGFERAREHIAEIITDESGRKWS